VEAAGAVFERMFGAGPLRRESDGGMLLAAGNVTVQLVSADKLNQQLGDAAPDPSGRVDYMASLAFRCASVERAAAQLNLLTVA
jgi:hypothetical protein